MASKVGDGMRRIITATAAITLTGCAPRLYTEDTGPPPTDWTAPENSWPTAAPPAGLVGTGFAEGQVALDIRGTDQLGDELSLWQFWGHTVLVDISTMWCAPCQELGMGTEDVYQRWADRGFIYLTVLHENTHNEPPSLEELGQWATLPSLGEGEHSTITAPIIADPKGVSGSIQAIHQGQYPALLLIGPDMVVLDRVEPVTEARVEEVLASHFGE